jgi:hypothetical protein
MTSPSALRADFEETSACWDIAGSVRPLIIEYFLTEREEMVREIVEKLEGLKKEGLREYTDQEVDLDGRPTGKPYVAFSCERCGGYDDCDCSGYNQALEDVISLITNVKD